MTCKSKVRFTNLHKLNSSKFLPYAFFKDISRVKSLINYFHDRHYQPSTISALKTGLATHNRKILRLTVKLRKS